MQAQVARRLYEHANEYGRCFSSIRKFLHEGKCTSSPSLYTAEMKVDRSSLRSAYWAQTILKHLSPSQIANGKFAYPGNKKLVAKESSVTLASLYHFPMASRKHSFKGNYSITPEELMEMGMLFPLPKMTIYNIYQGLLRRSDFSETFSHDKNKWSCCYTVHWPDNVNVCATAPTKKESSGNAALALLHYLMNNEILFVHTSNGVKLTFNNNDITTFRKSGLLNSSLRISLNNNIQTRNLSTSHPNKTRSVVKPTNKIISEETVDPSATTPINESDVVGPAEIDEIRKLFHHPKNALHNCFDIVAQELKKNDLKLTPVYKYVSLTKMWTCTYHLKWPENIQFSKSALRKMDASHKTALVCLHWLKSNNKITASGQPLLYDNEVIRDLKRDTVPVLNLREGVENNLNLISEIYENKLLKHLTGDFGNDIDTKQEAKDNEEFEKLWPEEKRKLRQNFLGLDVYMAKEATNLPISKYKQEIIDMIENNNIIIIKGEPGCGKSTRIPQYVLEGWAKEQDDDERPCRIVVTQPRRIAAISLAERVSYERQENVGDIVGYQVRLKSNFNSHNGRILYCTTGILLRRIQSDPSLSDCTHILLDEAHERDVNTDLLMNLLKHAVKLNPNLKLVVMSATIDTNLFQKYFGDVPVMHIAGFTHPVEAHFINDTKSMNFTKTLEMCEGEQPGVVHEDVINLINRIHKQKPEGAILCFLPGWEDIIKIKKTLPSSSDLHVLCLHSKLQDSEQRNVFSRPPPGVRKVILATNIAETSVTIDDVVYVIDTGIHKENRLDVEKGVTCIDNHWISQSSMTQRKGRAGRVQSGESYHMYPKSKSESFDYFSMPEILRTSLTKIVLDSKVYSNNMNAVEFLSQLPSPPETEAVMRAVEELKDLELLDENENLTPLGRVLSNFQLEPKLSKAMVNAIIFKCVTPIVDIVTLFSSEQEIFATTLTDKEGIKRAKCEFSRDSDHLSLMRIFEKWLEFNEENVSMIRRFTSEYNLVDYKLKTLQKLREIHFEYLNKGLHNVLPIGDDFSDNDELVKAVLLSGVGTLLQHRNWDVVKGRLRKTNVLLTRHNQRATIASASVNFKRGKFPSTFLLYINETRSNIRRTTTIRETSLISHLAVLLFKNKNIEIEKVTNCSDKLDSQDQVRLKLEGTKIEFICDRKHAEAIRKCKVALKAGMEYYIFQLTKGAEYDNETNRYWKQILKILDNVLS